MPIYVPNAVDIKKGDTGEEVIVLQSYLQKFGFIQQDNEENIRQFGLKIDQKKAISKPSRGEFDEKTEKALLNFQTYYKLPADGTLNKRTVMLMTLPRCGVPDVGEGLEKFVATGRKWQKKELTYQFIKYTSDLDQAAVKREIRSAFDQWSSVSPLTFTEIDTAADIKIKFARGNHGENYSFDGLSGVLAHAYYPQTGMDGVVCFDEDELWTSDNPASGTDLQTVAIHELGHTLGLDHSTVRQAIMFAYYGGVSRSLFQDDVDGVKHIYNP